MKSSSKSCDLYRQTSCLKHGSDNVLPLLMALINTSLMGVKVFVSLLIQRVVPNRSEDRLVNTFTRDLNNNLLSAYCSYYSNNPFESR